jgi:hypothetical protein
MTGWAGVEPTAIKNAKTIGIFQKDLSTTITIDEEIE